MRLISLFLLSFTCFNILGVELSLQGSIDSNHIQFKIINKDMVNVEINSNLCVSAFGNLSFKIHNDKGMNFILATKINDRCDGRSLTVLKPYHFIGRVFNIEELKSYYKLEKGNYEVIAVLCSEVNATRNKQCLNSNNLSIKVN